jgi:hypothetical protein
VSEYTYFQAKEALFMRIEGSNEFLSRFVTRPDQFAAKNTANKFVIKPEKNDTIDISEMGKRLRFHSQDVSLVKPKAKTGSDPVLGLVDGTLENIEIAAEHSVDGPPGVESIDFQNDISGEFQPITITNVREVQYGIMLQTEMKTLRLTGQSSGNDYEDMAVAYDILVGKLNENPEPQLRHADAKGAKDEMKYLNGGFADLARSLSAINAKSDFWSGVEHDWQNPNINDEASERLKLVIADAEEQATVFSDAFLQNYKKLGLDAALGIALSLLDSYETTYMMRPDYLMLNG